ncbi:MAG: fructose-bisphosphate aldolase class I [Alphaproteobacteria bacterium]|jgi:fructose-bisphosphate aldolase class I|nr:fructose-bisphosphate aldolase class I [Alphaproteobacteria bacterium]MDP6518015.1 fructose-bisphosphate aldolase class I [Alphaproteobacteria bacterium]
MDTSKLIETANAIVADGRGILAADESSPTIKKRFDSIGAESTEANRRDYREMLFTTAGAGEFISGAILFDETLRQDAADGTALVEVLQGADIIPGIKVDKGAKALPGHPGETVTEGLDGLRDRLAEYVQLGARFTKWRAVYNIGGHVPSAACHATNAHALARYAALSQEAGLVPIVEPEVLMDGSHDIDRCEAVTTRALRQVFADLAIQGVSLEGMLLKPNMVLSGKDCAEQASIEEVAERTIRCFERVVPAAVPGIVFLSGGQTDEQATLHLNAMNKMRKDLPWKLSFSYGRALQAAPLKAWAGKAENREKAQAAFYERAKANGAACRGTYA